MKPSLILAMALVLAPLGALAQAPAPAASPAAAVPKPKVPDIYDESANGDRQVADAVAIASKEHKRIVLEFGANWCEWCHRLHDLFEADASISKTLKSGYVVVLIDVNGDRNRDLVVKYDAKDYGLPFLVVLESDGKHLITKHSDDFEVGDHHDPQKVLAFLQEWAPKE
ncbi:MAG TPA: thioredoxin family protein [Chthoniobacteraceae bacterium]|nr:thioredoxin family protein [Chthoniobacteraceae bacterium]